MGMSVLYFKGTPLAFAPETLTVTLTRRVVQELLPQGGTLCREVGQQPLAVQGEGVLFGEQTASEEAALRKLFAARESGMLLLPGMAPFRAFFTECSVSRSAELPLCTVRFAFLEDTKRTVQAIDQTKATAYLVRRGDSWDSIAAQYGLTVEALQAANQEAARRLALTEGERLWIPFV